MHPSTFMVGDIHVDLLKIDISRTIYIYIFDDNIMPINNSVLFAEVAAK